VILTIDVGNSQIFGGLYQDNGDFIFSFRRQSSQQTSSDEFGVFLRLVLKENGHDPKSITKVGICTVVPDTLYSLKKASLNYFNYDPFVIRPGIKTGLNIKYKNPLELGSDRISTSIAATHKYEGKDIIVVDLGTATTFCAISQKRDYLGGAIMPGLKISMEALVEKTAKLPKVEIIKPEVSCGKSTVECIQSGLYFGHLGMVREILTRVSQDMFGNKKPFVIGTGGFAGLFSQEQIFDVHEPRLVLDGIYQALKMNT